MSSNDSDNDRGSDHEVVTVGEEVRFQAVVQAAKENLKAAKTLLDKTTARKPNPEDRKASTAWRKKFRLRLKGVSLAMQAVQDAEQLANPTMPGSPSTAGEKSNKMAKLPTQLPRVELSPETTKKYLVTFLERLERELSAEGTPQYQTINGKRHCRWADALLRVFAPDDSLAAKWVSTNLVGLSPQPEWKIIKAKFIEKFTRAHDQFAGLRELLPLPGVKGQGKDTCTTYLAEFERVVNESLQSAATDDGNCDEEENTKGESAWRTEHPIYTLLFIHGLRPSLRIELVKDKRFAERCNEGLTGIGELARQIEEEEASQQLILSRASSAAKDTAANLKRTLSVLGLPGGSPNKRGKFVRKSGGVATECSRCGRIHAGGNQSCWATRHKDGTVIGSAPTASAPGLRSPVHSPRLAISAPVTPDAGTDMSRVRCHKCRQFGHRRADCPSKVAAFRSRQGGGDRNPTGDDIDQLQKQDECFICKARDHEFKDCPHLASVKDALQE